jgi:hypothetical protein
MIYRIKTFYQDSKVLQFFLETGDDPRVSQKSITIDRTTLGVTGHNWNLTRTYVKRFELMLEADEHVVILHYTGGLEQNGSYVKLGRTDDLEHALAWVEEANSLYPEVVAA